MNSYGDLLKGWRQTRHLSQLGLAAEAQVSSRHISFLETGRSGPSRGMVLRLSEVLGVPRAARNLMLTAAGHAPVYRSRDLADPDIRPLWSMVERMIARHDPYPALVMDQLWSVLAMNDAATRLMSPSGIAPGVSLLTTLLADSPVRQAVENWPEVAHHALIRLRGESVAAGGIAEFAPMIEALEADPDLRAFDGAGHLPAVVPAIYRLGDLRLSLVSTFAQFGSAEDIALSEMKIEMMFPADDATRQFLEATG